MPPKRIVRGQRINDVKARRARELRKKQTPAENMLWQALRRNQLDGLHFRRQQVIDGFIVDFYCHAHGLVVEVDGDVHDDQVEYDAERDRILMQRELKILRLTNDEVLTDLEGTLVRIRGMCGLT